ncbi:hypothetical protein LN650_19055 [Klebsiella pneumoniae subsp. pneumoniae]|nr:hypothetical protein [Klebsiella pneumoniae subsp. pneumoniae]
MPHSTPPEGRYQAISTGTDSDYDKSTDSGSVALRSNFDRTENYHRAQYHPLVASETGVSFDRGDGRRWKQYHRPDINDVNTGAGRVWLIPRCQQPHSDQPDQYHLDFQYWLG